MNDPMEVRRYGQSTVGIGDELEERVYKKGKVGNEAQKASVMVLMAGISENFGSEFGSIRILQGASEIPQLFDLI